MNDEYQLLFIGKEGEIKASVADNLDRHGWNITSVEDIPSLPPHGRHDIGIMLLDASHLERGARFERLANDLDTRLIAIADADILNDLTAHHPLSRVFFGYHSLPVDSDRLHHALENLQSIIAIGRRAAGDEKQENDTGPTMVGRSPAMASLIKAIHKVAAVDAPVLIQGESGTGKELAARAIHRASSRADAPFNAVNCGALPANLIQSELFGHEKGSFTGASQRKVGIIEHTHGGTLFLDEIGDLPMDMQVNLLRFLENGTIQRVGGLQEIDVDIRVLAATHIDLEKAVAERRFREDLFHRLDVLRIKTPPLRQRGEDIPFLAHHFFKKFSRDKPILVNGFSRESLEVMQLYEWPGNIRELINRVRRAMVMSEHPLIRPVDLGLERRQAESRYARSLEEARDRAERGVVMAALTRNAFNVQHSARELGVSRVTLYRLMEKHDIHRRENHADDGASSAFVKAPSPPMDNVLTFNGTMRGRKG